MKVLTYEMGILVWDPEGEIIVAPRKVWTRLVSFPDEPAGTVANVNASEEERKNTTNHPVKNLETKEDQTIH